MQKLWALVAFVFVITGCSSSSGKSTSTALTTPSAPTTTITVPTTQSVQQVASIVAQYRGQIQSNGPNLANCAALETVQDTDDPLNVLTAKLKCQTGVLQASTPSLLLARALARAKPSSEVAALTAQTRSAAQQVGSNILDSPWQG